jgi:hypothetical protein
VERKKIWQLVARACRRNDDGAEEKRELLVVLWLHLSGISRRARHCFAAQDVREFDARVQDFEHALISGAQPQGRARLLDLAAFAAALDRVLSFDFDKLWRRRGYAVHMVTAGTPARQYWLALRRRHLDHSVVAVRQRILPHAVFRYHRVIPRIVEGEVRTSVVGFPPDYVKRVFKGQTELTIAAGVFADGAELDVTMGSASFEVVGFKNGREATRELSIGQHLDRALDDPRVGAILFPEMMVSKEFQPRVLEACRAKLEERGDHRALLLLPGSFHERSGGQVINTSSLYIVGRAFPPIEILRHGKFAPAWIKGVLEGISPSNLITLLATPVGLWGVAICMDFCADQTNAIWDALDLDLVLVPSLGNEETLRLHEQRLRGLSLRQRLHTVLAQQMLLSAPDGALVSAARGVVRAGSRRLSPVRGFRGLYKVTLGL